MSTEAELDALYEALRIKDAADRTPEENVFFQVWDWGTLLCLGGFEKLYENEVNLDDCIRQFRAIGLEAVIPIFEEAKKHIDSSLSEEEQQLYCEDHFDELKELARQYYDATTPVICQRVSDSPLGRGGFTPPAQPGLRREAGVGSSGLARDESFRVRPRGPTPIHRLIFRLRRRR